METAAKRIKRRLKLRRTLVEELGKITKNKDVLSLETKAKIIHSLVFLITMQLDSENWTVRKADRKKMTYLKYGVEGEPYGYHKPPEK